MKKSFLNLLLITAISLFIGCSSGDDSSPIVYPVENPIDAFFVASGFNQVVTNTIGSGADFVTGFRFSPKVNGTINAITLKIPDGNEIVKVNIFDFATGTLLHSENMTIINANTIVSKSINSISLTKDKDYIICMHTNDAYARTRTGGTSATYPVTSGNIVIKEFLVDPDFGGNFMPTGGGSSSFNGDLSFNFQQQ